MQTIPFNLYAWLTILMVIFMGVTGLDYGPMKKFEENAAKVIFSPAKMIMKM